MLIISDEAFAAIDYRLHPLLRSLRRAHVSRFPIHVVTNNHGTRACFQDSRFLNPGDFGFRSNIATMYVDGIAKNGLPEFVVYSRTIENAKFGKTNEAYNSRSSTDEGKILKVLKEHVKVFSPERIAMKSRNDARQKHRDWRFEANNAFTNVSAGISKSDIIEEVSRQMAIGTVFFTEKFKRLADEGVSLMAEVRRRESLPENKTMVFFNPDNSVLVSTDGISGEGTISNMYLSVDDLPVSIQGEVSMMRMVEPGTFIPEVGYRTDANTFWIYAGV